MKDDRVTNSYTKGLRVQLRTLRNIESKAFGASNEIPNGACVLLKAGAV